MRRGSGWDVSPVVLEKFRLIFFTIPKTGTTVFKQLFRRMMGYENWNHVDEIWPYPLPHNPNNNGLVYLYDFPIATANEMMTSPSWTRAIFVRDPIERVLSAYIEKALRTAADHNYIREHCCKNYQTAPERSAAAQNGLAFRDHVSGVSRDRSDADGYKTKLMQKAAVHLSNHRRIEEEQQEEDDENLPKYPWEIASSEVDAPSLPRTQLDHDSRPRHHKCDVFQPNVTIDAESFPFRSFVNDFMEVCDDPHWQPQFRRIPDAVWPYINFVGYFETIEEDTAKLLKKVKAWDDYGAWGWGTRNSSIFSSNDVSHRTSASELTRTYYTPEIEKQVRRYYSKDYTHRIMNFTIRPI